MKALASPFFWPLYSWMFLSIAAPSAVGNYDFLHVNDKNSLTVSVSKNSPPIAAIADNTLGAVVTEPVRELTMGKNVRVLMANGKSAWPRLQKVADSFEKEQARQVLRIRLAIHRQKMIEKMQAEAAARAVTSIPITMPEVHHSAPDVNVVRSDKISELIHLVQPVKYEYVDVPPTHVAAAQVQAPATTQTHEVERSLPRGEDAPPIVIDVGTPVEKKTTGIYKMTPVASAATPSAPAAPAIQQASAASSGTVTQQSLANDVMGLDATGYNYKIAGHVELSGGLAVTKEMNSLNIQWKTGNMKVDGVVNVTTGEFLIKTPMLTAGKVVATVTDSSQRLIGRGDFDLDGVVASDQTALNDVKLIIEPVQGGVGGEVVSAYSYDNVKVMVPGAEVFGPAQAREIVDQRGLFKLSALGSNSTYVLEANAPEHWGTRVIAESRYKERVPLFSNKMIQSLFDLMGEPNNFDNAIVWGEVKKSGKSVAEAKVALPGTDAVGPIYFNEFRIPDKNLKQTSSNGLFAFVKVKPGLHVVMAQLHSRDLPSVVVSASPSLVSYAEINMKALALAGRVYDPIFKQKISATVTAVGTSLGTQTNAAGRFAMKIPSTDAVIFVDANGGKDYFISREAVPRSQAKKINLLAFRKDWLSQQMIDGKIKQSESLGMLLGYIQGTNFHVALDNEPISDGNIFYFNDTGKIEPGRLESIDGGGAFLMTNLKPGLHTLLVTSADGQITTSRVIVAEAGVLNTVTGELNP